MNCISSDSALGVNDLRLQNLALKSTRNHFYGEALFTVIWKNNLHHQVYPKI